MQVSNLDEEVKQEESLEKKKSGSLEDLEFVRLLDPVHIPSYLVEQIHDRLYTTEKFYEFNKIICLMNSENGSVLNPSNFLYAIVHEKLRQVKGFLWMMGDFLNNTLVINNFSMDKEYWNKGEAMKLLIDKAKKVMKDLSFSRIVWLTKRPNLCENLGFKKAKEMLMVYEE